MHDFTIAPQLTALAEIFNENGARLYAVFVLHQKAPPFMGRSC